MARQTYRFFTILKIDRCAFCCFLQNKKMKNKQTNASYLTTGNSEMLQLDTRNDRKVLLYQKVIP